MSPAADRGSVRIQNVSIIFGENREQSLALADAGKSRSEIQAETGDVLGVHDCTVDINEGEILVLMGLSGSGKSTLLRAVNRLNPISRGSLIVNCGSSSGDRNRVAVIRVLYFCQSLDNVRLGDDIAKSQSGQCIRFAERSRHQNFFIFGDQRNTVHIREIDIRFVDQQGTGQSCGEFVDPRRLQERSGWTIWIWQICQPQPPGDPVFQLK